MRTLIEVSRAIGTISAPAALMQAIMRQVTLAFAADRSTLFLHDPERSHLWSRVAQGLEGWPHELRIPVDRGLCGRVFQSRRSMCIADTEQSPHFARDVAGRTGYVPRAMLLAPVRRGDGRCLGVLQVMDSRVGFFDADDLALLEAISVQVAIALENADLHEARRRQFDSFIRAFSEALDARDPTTARHSINVANYAMGIAVYLDQPPAEVHWLRIAGLLHDVGKIGTPESVLTKPGKLTDAEYALMREHAAHSRRILSRIAFAEELSGMADFAAAHHERLDGSGYPDGLSAEALPLKARILAVADVFDALTQDRHYRPGMSLGEALDILDRQSPHQLDADCVQALKRFLGDPAV